jgi:Tfp pilus assembly protein PilZ
LLTLTIKDKSALYLAYMPFVKNGGLFIPTNSNYRLGDEVFMLLNLMGEEEKLPVAPRASAFSSATRTAATRKRRSRITWPALSAGTSRRIRCDSADSGSLGHSRFLSHVRRAGLVKRGRAFLGAPWNALAGLRSPMRRRVLTT